VLRRIPLLTIAAAVAVLAASAAQAKERPLLGLVGDSELAQQLSRLDARTLLPAGPRVQLEARAEGWSFSPDDATLVVGAANESCVGGATALRFVDVGAMRALGDVPVARNGYVLATAWLDRARVVAVASAGDCIEQTKTVVAAVDAERRRLLRSTALPGDVVEVARAPGRLVVLLAPHGRIGTARLAVVDRQGGVRTVTLGGIRAGTKPGSPNDPSSSIVHPGLAVDPERGRAFVVPAGERLSEIDLATLRVTSRDTSERRSLFARFARWLDPPAQAKSMNGPMREALWLGNDTLAVTGIDNSEATTREGTTRSTLPAGLRLVDTRSWTYRTLDAGVSTVSLARGVLLASGWSFRSNGTEAEETHTGLIAYAPGGRELYRLFPEHGVSYGSYAGRDYVTVWDPRARALLFDARTGKTGRAVPASRVWRLLGDRAP
jgi:hypothetical protein